MFRSAGKHGLCLLLLSAAVTPANAFNSDGKTDLIWRNQATGENRVWFMNGPAFLNQSAPLTPASTNWSLVGSADFNRDGHPDLLWRDRLHGNNALWLMQRTNLVAPFEITHGDSSFDFVGLGDFNSDGDTDLLWRHRTNDVTAVWIMNGTNWTGKVELLPGAMPDRHWRAVGTGDINNDGHPDLIWRHATNGQNGVWFMEGLKIRTTAQLPSQPDLNEQLVGVAPMNRLGYMDLIWSTRSGSNTLWQMSGTNRLQSLALPSLPDTNWVFGTSGGFADSQLLTAVHRPSQTNLVLQWRLSANAPVSIDRKLPDGKWTNLAKDYRPPHFTNSGVKIGEPTELRVGNEFLVGGIRLPPVLDRGRVLLLVDKTLAKGLERELALFKTNLVGDGWTVLQHEVPRHIDNYETNWAREENAANVSRVIKPLIRAAYEEDPVRTKSVILIGHVTVPYSGFMAPDGHTSRTALSENHLGAWPADAYYGDIDGRWSDERDFSTPDDSRIHLRQQNRPGDGRFDQNNFPRNANEVAGLELSVGRVDFVALHTLKNKGELELLRGYLRKNDLYRHQKLTFANRVIVGSYFHPELHPLDRSIYQQGLRIGHRLFGADPANVIDGDCFELPISALWGLQGGSGFHSAINTDQPMNRRTGATLHSSAHLVSRPREPSIGFYLLAGSYFGDWNYDDNFLRTVLAAPQSGLASMWMIGAYWMFEPTATGAPLGDAMIRTVQFAGGNCSVTLAIMGDPTLRMQVTAPPSSLRMAASTGGQTLSWSPSPAPRPQYAVLRSANSLRGPWENLGQTGRTNFLDRTATRGPKLYQVRALSLVTTGSGSFTNASQGVFLSVP